jgi:cbb3-type cytochrome oxidase cytochrome c subunit
MAYLVASVGGVLFFAMSVGLLGEWPRRVLEAQTQAMAPEHPLGMTASERRGRLIYSREGCAYCHTQQIRYTDADMKRFGAPTLAWETRLDYPHLWGTRRIGPDLSRETGARSADWQYAHLFAPRSVAAKSVMPAYRSLFDGAPDRPTQEARDLVAYLDSLGRAREIAGPEGEAHAKAGCNCPDDEMAQMAFHVTPISGHPARTRRGPNAPPLAGEGDVDRGQRLYADHCASCHGASGQADGSGAAGLTPRPANLAEHEYTGARLADALWNGVVGTSMPAWRDRTPEDIASLARAVRELHATAPEPTVPADLLELGAKVYTENCSQCHGERGGGDGPAAAEVSPPPTAFTRQRPSLAEALKALRNGVDGTKMALWSARLGDAELVAVANYVRGFYTADPAGNTTR